jgi:hypothetical protein
MPPTFVGWSYHLLFEWGWLLYFPPKEIAKKAVGILMATSGESNEKARKPIGCGTMIFVDSSARWG